MAKLEAKRAARAALLSGYQHHSHASGRQMMNAVITRQKGFDVLRELNLETYADVLAPTRFRAMKNGLICLVTVVSRTAIEHGVENELAFALSDYYVNAVEQQTTEEQLETLMEEVVEHYMELVQEEQERNYSLPVTKAMRYINLHLYEVCRVCDVAAHTGLNAQYFAVLFKKEVGLAPSRYIARRKLEEAQYLMQQNSMSITEVSEALGYCNSSHFIKEYKKHFGTTPKKLLVGGQTTARANI